MTIRALSEVRGEHLSLRLDSEFCQKAFLANISRIRSWRGGWTKLGEELDDITGGATPLGADYPEHGVKFLRVQNVMPNYIEPADMAFISPNDDTDLARSRLKLNDVLLTITGVSYGKSAVVTADYVGGNINQHSVRMALKPGKIRPFFLAAFLNARAGKMQSDQNVTGGTRPALDYATICNFSVPLLSDEFQAKIERTVMAGHGNFDRAATHHAVAEQLLLRALGLEHWQPPTNVITTRKLSEVVENKRFDAEYFDPGAIAIIDLLRKNGADALEKFAQVATGFPWESSQFIEDRSNVGEPFVRIRDCKPGELVPENLDKLSAKYAASCGQTKAKDGDIVVGMDGLKWFYASLLGGPCYVNQRVAWLQRHTTSDYSSEFLLVCLNSIVGQRQLLRAMTIAHTVGHIKLDDIRSLLVPRLRRSIHDKITEEVRCAHATRREAQALLARAQLAVEVAIEQGESAAMKLMH